MMAKKHRILIGLGIMTALLGIGVDALPGSTPGLSLPQLLLTAAGLMLVLVAVAWRAAAVRGGGGGVVLAVGMGHCRGDTDCS